MKISPINLRNKYWNQRFEKGEIYSLKPSNFIKKISDYLTSSKKILVVGGGYGRNAIFLSKKGFEVTNIDISQKAISIGKRIYDKISNLKFKKMNLFNLQFKKKFDGVVAIYILSLFTETELSEIFKQINKTLVDDGKFCANFLSIEDDEFGMGKKIGKNLFLYDDGQLVKFYRKNEIKSLFTKNGFTVNKIVKTEEKRYIDVLNKKINSKSWLVLSRKK